MLMCLSGVPDLFLFFPGLEEIPFDYIVVGVHVYICKLRMAPEIDKLLIRQVSGIIY